MKTSIIELSLELFLAVPKGEPTTINQEEHIKKGIIIDNKAAYATSQILAFFEANELSGQQLNSTFHKSWELIENTSRETLFLHQILHYMTTYGTNFTAPFIYIPCEKLEIPTLTKIPMRIIQGLSVEELVNKALAILASGIALEEMTIDKVLELLELLGHQFTEIDQVKNKEALVKIIAKTGQYPTHPTEFLRYLIYKATDSTLLIKNKVSIDAIKATNLDISTPLQEYGLEKCAQIFHRFKPLWLAFKNNKNNSPFINKIRRLAKTHHQPMPVDILNTVTSIHYSTEVIQNALASANIFRKVRLLHALNTRINEPHTFLYRVRNGKSFATNRKEKKGYHFYEKVFEIIYKDIVNHLNVKGKHIYYPENIDYSLPSSEKMFLGNLPVGTKITAPKLVAGIYWENAGGAHDLDLSALSISGKVGWNSVYKTEELLYSGDITDAPDGATELLYVKKNLSNPALAMVNLYEGEPNSTFKIIVGQANKVTENYMFSPNNLIIECKATMKSTQQIIGLFLPEQEQKRKDLLSFILIDVGFGNLDVSDEYDCIVNARDALFYQYKNPISFRKLLLDAGAILNDEEVEEYDIDLRPHNLQKDTLINLLMGK